MARMALVLGAVLGIGACPAGGSPDARADDAHAEDAAFGSAVLEQTPRLEYQCDPGGALVWLDTFWQGHSLVAAGDLFFGARAVNSYDSRVQVSTVSGDGTAALTAELLADSDTIFHGTDLAACASGTALSFRATSVADAHSSAVQFARLDQTGAIRLGPVPVASASGWTLLAQRLLAVDQGFALLTLEHDSSQRTGLWFRLLDLGGVVQGTPATVASSLDQAYVVTAVTTATGFATAWVDYDDFSISVATLSATGTLDHRSTVSGAGIQVDHPALAAHDGGLWVGWDQLGCPAAGSHEPLCQSVVLRQLDAQGQPIGAPRPLVPPAAQQWHSLPTLVEMGGDLGLFWANGLLRIQFVVLDRDDLVPLSNVLDLPNKGVIGAGVPPPPIVAASRGLELLVMTSVPLHADNLSAAGAIHCAPR